MGNMVFFIKNPENTLGLTTRGVVHGTYDVKYEFVSGWKHTTALKPEYLSPDFVDDTVQYDAKLLKNAETIFKAVDQIPVFYAVPGQKYPLCVMEEQDPDTMGDDDLVVLIAPRVTSDE